MHGIGNDFVVVNCLDELLPEERLSGISKKVNDRKFGVGGDGLILVLPSRIADFRMRMLNPDGSEAEMCGNGIRCFAKYVYDREINRDGRFAHSPLPAAHIVSIASAHSTIFQSSAGSCSAGAAGRAMLPSRGGIRRSSS